MRMRAFREPGFPTGPEDEEEESSEDGYYSSPEAAARDQMEEIKEEMLKAVAAKDYERAEELRGQGVNLEAAFFPEWSSFARTRIPHAVYLRSYLKDE